MISIGIDIGSVAAKAVVLQASDQKILSRTVIPTGWDHRQAIEDVSALALSKAGISPDDVGASALTGYGRIAGKDTLQAVSEIACHAKGAHFLYPEAGGVIDIGGQDSKAILLGTNGAVIDFAMNDKCAAGTGRFVSMVATLLGRSLESFAELAAEVARQSGKPVGFVNLPQADYAKALEGFGLPAGFAAVLADSDARAGEGALFDDSRTLSRLIGRATTPMSATVRDALA